MNEDWNRLALASPTRQEVMFLFNGDAEPTVGEVAKRLDLAPSAASTHLSTLREAGVLTSRREWRTVYCRVDPEGVLKGLDGLRDYLMACCPSGSANGCC